MKGSLVPVTLFLTNNAPYTTSYTNGHHYSGHSDGKMNHVNGSMKVRTYSYRAGVAGHKKLIYTSLVPGFLCSRVNISDGNS